MTKGSSRRAKCHVCRIAVFIALMTLPFINAASQSRIEKWHVFETTIQGTDKGNPFTRCPGRRQYSRMEKSRRRSKDSMTATVSIGYASCRMHSECGAMKRSAGRPSLRSMKGSFECIAPTGSNHGPVDHTRTLSISPMRTASRTTLCGPHVTPGSIRGIRLAQQTLRTLANGYIPKNTACVFFPEGLLWNKNEPSLYPFEGKPLTDWDYTRFESGVLSKYRKADRSVGLIGD